jgi:hypothetical protein
MLPNCSATQFAQLALSRNDSTPRSGPMAASLGDLEHAAQLQFVRALKAEQKAEDIQHALNLMLNLGFEQFHTALTIDGAVHEFDLGVVRNFSTPDGFDMPPVPKSTRPRRIVLWRTAFPQGHLYGSAFHESEFRSLPRHLELGSELRNLLEEAAKKLPAGRPFLIKSDPA